MKRLYFLGGAALALVAMSYLSSYIPTHTAADWSPFLTVADLLVVPFAFVVGAVLFDLVASGVRYSVLSEIAYDYLSRARAFVNRRLRWLEVRRSRGSVAVTTL